MRNNKTNYNLKRMMTFIKTKLKKSDDQTKIANYRVTANIISKLIFLGIIFPNFMKIRQLFHVKNLCKNVKNQHVYNGCMDFLVKIIELLSLLHCT